MGGQIVAVIICAGFTLLVVLTAWVIFFRLSCRLCKLKPPSIPRTLGIVLITFAATSLAEGILAAVVRASYSGLGLPLWEAGISAFFIGLPVDMAVNAGVHTAMMRIPPGKGIEVWFVQRVLLLGVILGIGGLAALAFLAGQGGP